MTRTRWGAWPAAALLALAACGGGGPETVVEGDTAFVNVNVLPMDAERVLEGQTVVIAGGRIAALGSAAEVGPAAGVEIIDAAGGYLLPGLAEMHGHLPTPRMAARDAHRAVVILPGEQAQRKADHAGAVRQHAIHREMRLAGVGRPEDGGDAPLRGAGNGGLRPHGPHGRPGCSRKQEQRHRRKAGRAWFR